MSGRLGQDGTIKKFSLTAHLGIVRRFASTKKAEPGGYQVTGSTDAVNEAANSNIDPCTA